MGEKDNKMMGWFSKPKSGGDESLREFINKENSENKVCIWSKAYCPYCTRTKDLFKSLQVEVKVYELDQMQNGSAIQNELALMTNQRTVPNVFVNGNHLGGSDDTHAAHNSGRLMTMLNN